MLTLSQALLWMSWGLQNLCLPSFGVGRSFKVCPIWSHHLKEKVKVPSVKSDFSKATQLVSRIAIVPRGPVGVRDKNSPGMPTFPEGQVAKLKKGPYFLLPHTVYTLISSSPRWGRGFPKVRGWLMGSGEIMEKTTPRKGLLVGRHTCLELLGMASQGVRDVLVRLSLKGKRVAFIVI